MLRKASTTQRGVDLVADKDGTQLWIEAKGETSSRVESRRYGQPFNAGQIADHVAKAFFAAVSHSEQRVNGRKVRAGIALPDTPLNRRRIEMVEGSVARLGITVFWVAPNKSVREQS